MIVGFIVMKKHSWSIQEQSIFLKRIGELLSRGYPLSEAIESICFQLPAKRREDMNQCLSALKEGYPFHHILARLQFHHNLIGYVYFAEQHGGLAHAFQEGSEMMLKRSTELDKLKKLLFYPFMLIMVTFLLFAVVERFILPRFTSLFLSMDLESNIFTKFILEFGRMMPYLFAGLVLVILLFLCYYFFQYRHYSQVKQKQLLVALPVFGPFFTLYFSHYFSIQFSYLLEGGLSIQEALQLFEHNERQPFYRELGAIISGELRKGESLEAILHRFPFFARELSPIIRQPPTLKIK